MRTRIGTRGRDISTVPDRICFFLTFLVRKKGAMQFFAWIHDSLFFFFLNFK